MRFFEGVELLHAATTGAFNRTLPDDATALDKVIFYFGVRAVDDFGAILVLAANGIGLSATALLRGLYERVITSEHLRKNPDEAKLFLDFAPMQAYRTLTRLQDAYKFDHEERAIFDEISASRNEVSNQFKREACPTCKRSGMPNWTTIDFVNMAKSIQPLGGLLAAAYDLPLAQIHATPTSIVSMLTLEGDAVILRDDFSEEADRAFQLGHMLLLHALKLQLEHFGDSSLEALLEPAAQHYVTTWQVTKGAGA